MCLSSYHIFVNPNITKIYKTYTCVYNDNNVKFAIKMKWGKLYIWKKEVVFVFLPASWDNLLTYQLLLRNLTRTIRENCFLGTYTRTSAWEIKFLRFEIMYLTRRVPRNYSRASYPPRFLRLSSASDVAMRGDWRKRLRNFRSRRLFGTMCLDPLVNVRAVHLSYKSHHGAWCAAVVRASNSEKHRAAPNDIEGSARSTSSWAERVMSDSAIARALAFDSSRLVKKHVAILQ